MVLDNYSRGTARSYEIPEAVFDHRLCDRVARLECVDTVILIEAHEMNRCFTLRLIGGGFDNIVRDPVRAKTECPPLQVATVIQEAAHDVDPVECLKPEQSADASPSPWSPCTQYQVS